MEVRREFYNGECIYKILPDDGKPCFYFKNVKRWIDECRRINSYDFKIHKKNKTILFNNHLYYSARDLLSWTVDYLIKMKEEMFFISYSADGKDWKDYYNKCPLFYQTVFNNPFSIISCGRIVTINNNRQYGVVNRKNEIIVPYGKYSYIDGFKFKLARVKKRNTAVFFEDNTEKHFETVGIIDINGKEEVKCEYDEIYKFYNRDNWFTLLINNNKRPIKYHLGYRRTFGDFSEVDDWGYDEDHGLIEWKG